MHLTTVDHQSDAAAMPQERLERAIDLFQSCRVTEGKAAELAGLPRRRFSEILAARGIPWSYGVEELEEDLATLRELRKQWPSSATLLR